MFVSFQYKTCYHQVVILGDNLYSSIQIMETMATWNEDKLTTI